MMYHSGYVMLKNMKGASNELPPANHYHSRRDWEKACWQKIIKSPDLLRIIITANERRNFVLRALAIDRLSSGKKYREIGEELWLSPQTISSVKKALREQNYRSYWERGKTERKKKVYSGNFGQTRKKYLGRSVRTKYGTLHFPG